MNNEVFERWEALQAGAVEPLRIARRKAWQACEAHMRQPMACGHPRACLREIPLTGTVTEDGVHGCLACAAIAKAVDAALLAVEDSLNGILSGHRAVGLPTGEIEICRNVVVRLREKCP